MSFAGNRSALHKLHSYTSASNPHHVPSHVLDKQYSKTGVTVPAKVAYFSAMSDGNFGKNMEYSTRPRIRT